MTSNLTVTSVMAMATQVLAEAGFVQAEEQNGTITGIEHVRLFEDSYSVVGVCAWEEWDGLSSQWPRAQAWLVEAITSRLDRSDAKAWDGYIVLFTPSRVPKGDRAELDAIRYDTTRLRKLVGVELESEGAVRRTLAPLLPLDPKHPQAPSSGLRELLYELIPPEVAPPTVVEALADAFRDGRPLVDSIHRALTGEDDAH